MSTATETTARVANNYARQAICTRYAGPTNTRGSRIIVTADAGRMIVPWNHELDSFHNHAAAAERFAAKWGWTGKLVGGGTKDGYAFCFLAE